MDNNEVEAKITTQQNNYINLLHTNIYSMFDVGRRRRKKTVGLRVLWLWVLFVDFTCEALLKCTTTNEQSEE